MPAADVIATRIGAYLADPDERLLWLRSAVREHGFLPLHIGWLAVIGVRPDGTFVAWWHEHDPPTLTAASPFDARLAAVRGSLRYPELSFLVPSRPAHAVDCASCAGKGLLPPPLHQQGLVCACGGVGWILPEEERGPATG